MDKKKEENRFMLGAFVFMITLLIILVMCYCNSYSNEIGSEMEYCPYCGHPLYDNA